MGFSTRSYAAPYLRGGGLPRGVKLLIIANVAMFLITWLLGRVPAVNSIISLLALTPSAVITQLYVWQVFTYLFLHSDILHILMNMMGLWFFGGDIERSWGTDRFLNLYFFCGVGSGILAVIFHYLTGTQNVTTIGASGAIFGIILVAAILWPDQIIIFYVFPIKLKYFAMIIGGIAFYGLTMGSSGVSNIAHLGGMALAYAWLKFPRKRSVRGRGGPPSGNVFASAQDWYKRWKLERNKKKFQVYLRKHGSDRDPWVH